MPVTNMYKAELTYAPDASGSARAPARLVGLSADRNILDFAIEGVVARADASSDVRASVSVLLDRHLSAYGIVDVDNRARRGMTDQPRWQRAAAAELERTVERLDDDRPVSAEFAFLAALSEPAVSSFLSRGRRLLQDVHMTRRSWQAFIDGEARAAADQTTHEALAPMPEAIDSPAPATVAAELLTLADLRARVHRGALRGSRTVVEASDA